MMPAQNGVTPLFIASQNGHVSVVKELLSRGAAVDKAKQVHCGAAALVCWLHLTHVALLTRSWLVICWHPSPLHTSAEHHACADTLVGLCPWRFALFSWGMVIQCFPLANLSGTGFRLCNQLLCIRLLASALVAFVCWCLCCLLVKQAALITPADPSSSTLHDGQGNRLLSECSMCGQCDGAQLSHEHSAPLMYVCACMPVSICASLWGVQCLVAWPKALLLCVYAALIGWALVLPPWKFVPLAFRTPLMLWVPAFGPCCVCTWLCTF